MAVSKFVTSLPLDTYADTMGINSAHFNQMNGQNAPTSHDCDKIWDQPDRDQLARTIQQAENMIKIQLGYDLVPTYYENADVRLLKNVRADWWNGAYLAPHKKVESYGTQTMTLLFAGAPITYQDLDNDPRGIKETAVIGDFLYDMLPKCDGVCKLHVFYRRADGARYDADPEWEIRPIEVTEYGEFQTIRAPATQFLKPELMRLTERACYKSDDEDAWIYAYDEANLVEYVDIYCQVLDEDEQGTVTWLTGCGVCDTTSADICIYPVLDSISKFVVAPKAGECISNCPPRKMQINYTSGYPLDNLCQMDTNLQRAVVKLTNALLPQSPCGCEISYNMWVADREPVNPLTLESANLPWDLNSQGALEAWRIVKSFM
jgi:hypothetical protein